MPDLKPRRTRIVWGKDVSPAEQDEVRSLLEVNGFGYNEIDGGLDVMQAGQPASLPADLNDRIARLIYVFGVFDGPVKETVKPEG